MKPRQLPVSSRTNRKLAGSSIVLAFSLLTPSVFATPYTWNNTGTDFATGANWGGTAPTNSLTADTAIFNAATTAIPSLAADRSILGVDFTAAAGGATLTSAAGVTLTLGATGIDATTQFDGTNTVSVANLKLGAAQTWTLFGNTTSIATTSTFSMSSNIDLNSQNLTVNPNRNGTGGNGTVNLSGKITGAAGANGLFFSGSGAFRNTLNLTGANTYTGKTTISNLTLTANSLADSGTSALGFGDLTLGGSATSAGVILTFQNLAADSTTSRLVTTSSVAGSGVAINNNDGDNSVAFTNAGNLDTHAGSTSNLNFNLGGSNTGNNTFGQVINERTGTGVTNFTKSGTGTWVLSNAGNSFAGAMTLSSTTTSAGILAYASADGANSINFSQTTGSATLSYTGASAKTMSGLISAGALSTGAITLDASGVTSADAINYSNPGSLGTSGASGAKNLTLNGTNTGTNTLAGRWENNTAGGAATLIKKGIGKWTISGANSYTGGTTLDNGTLTVTGDQSAANGGWLLRGYGDSGTSTNTATTTVNFDTGSTIAVASGKTVTIGGGTGGTAAQTLTDKGSATNAGTLLLQRMGVLNIDNGATWSQSGGMTLSGAGGYGSTLAVKSGGSFTYSGVSTVKMLTGGGANSYLAQLNIDGTGVFNTGAGFEDNGTPGAATAKKVINLSHGGTLKLTGDVTALTTQVQLALGTGGGVIHTNGFNTTLSGEVTTGAGSALASGITGIGGLTKDGDGTLTLSGANSYAGATLISGGTLALGASGTIDNTSEVSLGTVGTFDVSAKSLGYTVATLKGSGNVTGALTVSTQLAIGNSPGTTHFSGSLTLDSATYVYEMTGGASPGVGSADLGMVADNLTIIGGSILDLVELGTFTEGNKFTLFGYGALSGTFDGLADGATFTDAGGIWMIDYDDGIAGANGGTGTGFVTITAVPEPNAAALLGGFGILALLRRRR